MHLVEAMTALDAVVGGASVPHLAGADAKEEVRVKLLACSRYHEIQN